MWIKFLFFDFCIPFKPTAIQGHKTLQLVSWYFSVHKQLFTFCMPYSFCLSVKKTLSKGQVLEGNKEQQTSLACYDFVSLFLLLSLLLLLMQFIHFYGKNSTPSPAAVQSWPHAAHGWWHHVTFIYFLPILSHPCASFHLPFFLLFWRDFSNHFWFGEGTVPTPRVWTKR